MASVIGCHSYKDPFLIVISYLLIDSIVDIPCTRYILLIKSLRLSGDISNNSLCELKLFNKRSDVISLFTWNVIMSLFGSISISTFIRLVLERYR